MMKYAKIFFTVALFSMTWMSCQSDHTGEKGRSTHGEQSGQKASEEERMPANLEIVRAEFDDEGFSEYLGHIIGRNTRYHTVEAPKGTELKIDMKADHTGTKIVLIKPRGGILWENVVSNPDEKLIWNGELPVDGKYTVEVTLTGKPKQQEVASQYTLRMQKSSD